MEGVEFMEPERFQYLLREFGGPLADVEVRHETDAMRLFTPWQVQVMGPVSILGHPRVFEFEIDLRTVQSVEHITHIAGLFLQACEEAANRPEAQVP